jgi:hypothetical protein
MNRSTKEYGWSSGPLEFQTAFVVLVVMLACSYLSACSGDLEKVGIVLS